ncbi:MAG: PIN domain-containing protein [bacterium]|nr:PIN domain-containing protein [bacterium]
MLGLLDSTVIVHLLRHYNPALNWFDASQTFGISSITWMEIVVGVTNKQNMRETLEFLDGFDIYFITQDDQLWAQEQLKRLRFSHHTGMNDCLIASVAYRLQTTLYTHNLKHMTPLIGKLAVKPYG